MQIKPDFSQNQALLQCRNIHYYETGFSPGALAEPAKKQAIVPAIYIVKYNKFVDTILEKMNDVLRESYDPVSVKLQPIDASKKSSKPKKNKNKSKR